MLFHLADTMIAMIRILTIALVCIHFLWYSMIVVTVMAVYTDLVVNMVNMAILTILANHGSLNIGWV